MNSLEDIWHVLTESEQYCNTGYSHADEGPTIPDRSRHSNCYDHHQSLEKAGNKLGNISLMVIMIIHDYLLKVRQKDKWQYTVLFLKVYTHTHIYTSTHTHTEVSTTSYLKAKSHERSFTCEDAAPRHEQLTGSICLLTHQTQQRYVSLLLQPTFFQYFPLLLLALCAAKTINLLLFRTFF